MLAGRSFSELERFVLLPRRAAALADETVETVLAARLGELIEGMDRKGRIEGAAVLAGSGVVTQRQAGEMTGVSRDTIRRRVREAQGA